MSVDPFLPVVTVGFRVRRNAPPVGPAGRSSQYSRGSRMVLLVK